MADTVKTEITMKIEFTFADGDTRTLTVSDPSEGLTQQDFQDLADAAKDVVIGDKTGAAFSAITKATRVEKQTTNLDLTTG